MDDDAVGEQGQNPPCTGRWTTTSSYGVYMVDTPKDNAITRNIQSRMNLLRYNQSADISGAALNHATEKQQYRHRRR